jgi:excisionase family DNA binding protein
MATDLVTVAEACAMLGVSRATVWRMIKRGDLPSVRRRGRRLVPSRALARAHHRRMSIPPFTCDNPIFRLIGIGDSGGKGPGARNKHDILDR